MYPFVISSSQMLKKPAVSPEAALEFELSRSKPQSLQDWVVAIRACNVAWADDSEIFDKRTLWNRTIKHFELAFRDRTSKLPDNIDCRAEDMCWLPTDFNVNDDGSVTVLSYINNLHPKRYAKLYESISKAFASFVPLLEQVATDAMHPRALRAKVDEGGNKITCSNPASLPFIASGRPITPYSVRGLTLQASVEMVNIYLGPEKPAHLEDEWTVAGRKEERVFAVGLYFYDMENITSAKLMFRDQVGDHSFYSKDDKNEFCAAHDVEYDSTYSCTYSQPVDGVEIKAGGFICYPNSYQTKMPLLELIDKTKPEHVKFIKFSIVDPSTRSISTGVVPPQQPDWEIAGASEDLAITPVVEGMSSLALNDISARDTHKSASQMRDRLKFAHIMSNKAETDQFVADMYVDDR